jgi:hypothetical protein
VREELKGQELSFTEIAKIVGERWQLLPSEVRDIFERQAQSAKEKYYAELAEYKKTTQYAQYQEYLADFKAKHAAPRTGNVSPESHRTPLIVSRGKANKIRTSDEHVHSKQQP